MSRHRLAAGLIERLRDRRHHRIGTQAARIVLHLLVQIPGVEARQTRRGDAVAAAIQAMAGEAGVGRPAAAAAQRDEFPAGRKRTAGAVAGFAAAGGQRADDQKKGENADHASKPAAKAQVPGTAQRPANCPLDEGLHADLDRIVRAGIWAMSAVALALATGCADKTVIRRELAGADAARGLAVIETVGCAACHQTPGIAWPRGRVGGALAGFASRPLIAGRFPNQPDVLVRWLRDAPSLAPATGMPPQPLTEQQARDVAAYLYGLDGS
jgi:hypothetical protein